MLCCCHTRVPGKPIFPGQSTMNQLEKIMELTGIPNEETTAKISKFAPNMLENARSMGLPPEDEPPAAVEARFRKHFPTASPEALDLLIQTLRLNPDGRITAEEALNHPYVSQFHDPAVERDSSKMVMPGIDDDKKMSTAVRLPPMPTPPMPSHAPLCCWRAMLLAMCLPRLSLG